MPAQSQNPRNRLQVAIAVSMITVGALLAVPKPRPAPDQIQAARYAHTLRIARQELDGAVDRYRAEHGSLPGRVVAGALSGTLQADLFVRQLTRATDITGQVAHKATDDYPYGPYLYGDLPANPVNGLTTVRFASAESPTDGSAGWIIDPRDGQVRADIAGETEQ